MRGARHAVRKRPTGRTNPRAAAPRHPPYASTFPMTATPSSISVTVLAA
ncbi:hypothetical protein SRIMR7_33500 [Streptomyces rimosus subsp. rimosus]|uniref:Uncharacterized protein n=1 Tax=Streptomyces rimosus subsp. rimosus TaxID=132474 RepID=A0ABY3ZAA4_STRRM|nr:hypothetical protein SRIMR7_33500 [Streptomyces rimosus subsp. rimosus]